MVCAFGLTPEASLWLSRKGASIFGLDQTRVLETAASISQASVPKQRSSQYFSSFSEGEAKPEAEKDGASGEEEGKAEHPKCFPAAASVYVKGKGPVPVSDLQPGDVLLCGDPGSGRLNFSPFLGYLHLEATATTEYLRVEMSVGSGALVVSRDHFVYASSSETGTATPVRADSLQEGDWVLRVGCDGDITRVQVSTISTTTEKGIYCPLTECGTVAVEGTLCSCYADCSSVAPWFLQSLIATHAAAHTSMLPLRLACRMGVATEKRGVEGIHPLCRAMMSWSPSLELVA